VLQWIVGRVKGTAAAAPSPIGDVPAEGALDLTGLDLAPGAIEELFRVDKADWLAEVADRDQFLRSFGTIDSFAATCGAIESMST
jgi:phosphoenolpyruvate carboxykinase (GTP)